MIKDRILRILKLDNLFGNLSGYFESRIELFKMEVKEEFVGLLAQIMVILIVALCVVLALLFISLGCAYYFGSMVGTVSGFMIVAGFYALIFLILLGFRKPISDALHRIILEMAQQHNSEKNEAAGKE
jgi:uncharacterized membrane protein